MKTIPVMIAFVFSNSWAFAEDKYRVKVAPLEPPTDLNESIRKLLPKECESVKDANGATVAEFWFRSELPGKGTAEQIKNGLTWREVTETVIVGAVKFPSAFIDYRKQEIAAGVYTLRLAYQPDNGDHKDSAPHTEFALLVPAAKDAKPDEMEAKALYKLSFASTGDEHPGVMLLYPGDGKAKAPAAQDRGKGVWTLNLKRTVVSPEGKAELPFAITIAGFSKLR